MGVHITNSKEETVLLAKEFSKELKPGDLILFNGGLGCGKTAFCGGIASALGVSEPISSPTFSIVNVYNGDITFAHFDLYRINSMQDLEMSGFFDYLDEGAIIAAEWGERLSEVCDGSVAYNYLITMQLTGESERKITIEKGGAL